MAIILIVLVKLVELLNKLSKAVGLESALSAFVLILLVITGFVLLCYGAGSLVHTKVGGWSFDKFEKLILAQVPGYRIIKNIIIGVSEEKVKSYKPALIQLGPKGTAIMGFVMEENGNETITVFVPNSPVLTMGNIYIVEKNRVTLLESGYLDMFNCISEWGTGSGKVVGTVNIM